MALTKVNIEALLSLQQTLKKAWSNIVDIKLELDHYCYNFEWEDPVGRNFIDRYEAGMRPIKSKLIPELEQYMDYLSKLTINIDDYTDTSRIHITGGEDIESVLPQGTPLDFITIDKDAVPHISNETLHPLNDSFIIPNADEFSNIYELLPGEQIKLDNGTVAEVVPIANGCGTENGFEHWAAQTGAGIDAALNSSNTAPIAVGGIALVGLVTGGAIGGVASLIAISESGRLLNPEEFDRLNNEVCAAHDICYVEGEKVTCEKEFYNNGGRFMSFFTSRYGDKAYKEAQQAGIVSKEILEKIKQGKKVVLPEGYILKLKEIEL